MDKILIILKTDVITAYDIDGTSATVHKIKGENETYIEDYIDVPKGLKNMYNDDKLSNLSVDVVYTNNDTEILRDFAEELLPCGEFQAFSFEKILAELLLKSKKLQPDKSICVKFDGSAYKVQMSADGKIKLDKADDGEELADTDIASIYKTSFSVFTDSKKQAELEKELAEARENADKLSSELKKEKENGIKLGNELKKTEERLKNELIKKEELNNKNKELEKKIDLLQTKFDKLEKTVHEKEENIKKGRTVIWGYTDYSPRRSITWGVENLCMVSKGEQLLSTGWTMLYEFSKSPCDGRLIQLVENNHELICNIPIAVIVNINDCSDDLVEWVNKLKEEIKEKENHHREIFKKLG